MNKNLYKNVSALDTNGNNSRRYLYVVSISFCTISTLTVLCLQKRLMSGIPKSVRADFSERCGGSICFRVHFFVFINGRGNRQYLPVSERRVILIARVGEQQRRRRRRRRRHCRTDRNSIATDANRATPPMSAAAAAAAAAQCCRLRVLDLQEMVFVTSLHVYHYIV